MSEEAHAEQAAPKRKLGLDLILAAANTVFVLAALGTMVYTKLIYQKPAIVEETEIEKKKEETKLPPAESEHVFIGFEENTYNLALTSGRAHYLTLAFSLECRDEDAGSLVRTKKSLLIDKLISILGHVQISDIDTIQGKLLLKAQIMREFNQATQAGAVVDVFFSTYTLQ